LGCLRGVWRGRWICVGWVGRSGTVRDGVCGLG
jgi:hypothetical protein